MTTQLESASAGIITEQMKFVAASETVSADFVQKEIAAGKAVIPANPAHKNLKPWIVGRAFRTKINANIGMSASKSSLDEELEKLDLVIKTGAEFVMDLSVGPNLDKVRTAIINASTIPLGTVPLYEAFWRADGEISNLTPSLFIDVIKEQAKQGVDFMTLHAGLLKRHISLAAKRKLGIVSRGGSIMAEWMVHTDQENPLFTNWDEILDICKEHDVTISLGDGLRPGCLADASDDAQFAELDILGDLVLQCRSKGVQVMVEGPGHIPFNQIQMNMEREAERCHNAPFYVLGPIVTDIAPGYDHITSGIGATAAAYYGASLLCYVTPAEHLALPTREDVKTGIISHKIAAHAADVARGLPGAIDIDNKMAEARFDFDWKKQFDIALDGELAKSKYLAGRPESEITDDHCSMCGEKFCAMRTTKRFKKKLEESTI